ncbi:MAG: antibiotic biosynthesis monooxygenase family protein [Paracoccaceae bacterium]
MSVLGQLSIRVKPGTRDTALQAFRARRVFEECAEAIPGFVQAFLLADRQDPDVICVFTEWRSAQDAADWRQSPVRAAQSKDLAHFLQDEPVTRLFDRH